MKAAGYTISQMKEAGYSDFKLTNADYAIDLLKAGGYTISELKLNDSYRLNILRSYRVGYDTSGHYRLKTLKALRRDHHSTVNEFRAAVYNRHEIRAAGYIIQKHDCIMT
jgi:hypothetical protein